jgi:hypothetical protein
MDRLRSSHWAHATQHGETDSGMQAFYAVASCQEQLYDRCVADRLQATRVGMRLSMMATIMVLRSALSLCNLR